VPPEWVLVHGACDEVRLRFGNFLHVCSKGLSVARGPKVSPHSKLHRAPDLLHNTMPVLVAEAEDPHTSGVSQLLHHILVEAVLVPGDVQECQRFLRGVSRCLTVVLSLAKVVLLMTCRARVSELLAVIASVVPIVPLISCRAGVIELLAVIAGIVSIVPLISCRARLIEALAVMTGVAPIVPLISHRAGVIELIAVIAGIVPIVPLVSC